MRRITAILAEVAHREAGRGRSPLSQKETHSRATPHPTEIVDARATYQRRAQRPPCAKNNKQPFFKNRTRMAGFCFTGFTAPWTKSSILHFASYALIRAEP